MVDRLNQTENPGSALVDPGTDEPSTGLPGFSTWRNVYCFVLIVFVACVILLKAFELVFS
jgi:hypothetical protein